MDDELYDEVNDDSEGFVGLGEISADEVNKSFMNNDYVDTENSSFISDVPEDDKYKPVSFEPEHEEPIMESAEANEDVNKEESSFPKIVEVKSNTFDVDDDDDYEVNNTVNPSLPEMTDAVSSSDNTEEENNYRDVNEIINESVTVTSDNDISAGAASEEANKISEMAYDEVMQEIKGNPVSQGKDDFKCPNCMSLYAGTDVCPFCGNIGNEAKKDPEARTPDAIIPFKIGRKEAIKLFNKENRLRLLTPFGFKRQVKKKLVGMYLPYYLVDANVRGVVLYKARDIKKTEDDKFQYKERKNYMVKLSGNFDYEKVLIDVASKFPDKLNDYIFPYNFEEAIAYDENVIEDFYTIVRANIEDEEMANRIKNKVITSSISELNKSVRHDKMKVDNNALNVSIKEFKFIMLPVWLSMVTYKGKKYVFCVNGSSGKYISRVPLDSTKTLFVGFLLLVVIFAIALGISILL